MENKLDKRDKTTHIRVQFPGSPEINPLVIENRESGHKRVDTCSVAS